MDITNPNSGSEEYQNLSNETEEEGLVALINVVGLAEVTGGAIEGQ